MILKEWINSRLGQSIDFDGAYGKQCVDLIKDYTKEVFGEVYKPRGNAKDLWYKDWGSDYIKYKNTITFLPIPGDIVIWSNPPYGHIAVVKSANLLSFVAIEQNAGNGNGDGKGQNAIREHTYYYKNVLGFIRHKSIMISERPKKIFGPIKTYKGYKYPSSIYGIPVIVKKSSQPLYAISYIVGVNPKAKTNKIIITDQLLKKGYIRTLKTLHHEATGHFLWHLVYTEEQKKFWKNLSEYATGDEYFVSEYAKTNYMEHQAETIGYGMQYIDNNISLPKNKKWNDKIAFQYDILKKFTENALSKCKYKPLNYKKK